jgi:hypothetical protein
MYMRIQERDRQRGGALPGDWTESRPLGHAGKISNDFGENIVEEIETPSFPSD